MKASRELDNYGLIGFGSGIYGGKHHELLLDLADGLPQGNGKKAFIFSACGAPAIASGDGRLEKYRDKAHSALRDRLRSKGYDIVGEFMCAGFNTNSFLKLFGGISKGRPNSEDLKHAEEFAESVMRQVQGT